MEQRAETAPQTKGQRYRQIVATLARHGIGVLAEQIGKSEELRDRVRAEHVRNACEDLGPTFIKLAQALSTRADLLPEAYRSELMKLQDDAAPIPAAAIEEAIREELGAPPEQLFAFFDPKPAGSASIGQVHAARMSDGREVVVKVRKPGVENLVEIDLEILGDLAESWARRMPELRQYDLPAMVREFGDTLRSEFDYTREAQNIRVFTEILKGQQGYALPQVIGEYSTPHVITLTRFQGTKPDAGATLPKRRRVAIARRIARFVLEPAFSHGIFHADPHGGNFLILEDGTLAAIDFGMVGRLTPEARRRVAGIFIAVHRRDASRVADTIIEIASPVHPVDRAALAADVDRMLQRYVALTLEELDFGEALAELLEIIRRFGLRLPGNFALLFKALAMTEGLLECLDSGTSLNDHLEPLVNKIAYGRANAEEWIERARESAFEAAGLSVELPRRIDRVMAEVERGNVRVWTRIEDADKIVGRFERTVERANATMLASACIVGLAIILVFYHPQGMQRWIGVVFWAGVVIALIMALRTTFATLRRRGREIS